MSMSDPAAAHPSSFSFISFFLFLAFSNLGSVYFSALALAPPYVPPVFFFKEHWAVSWRHHAHPYLCFLTNGVSFDISSFLFSSWVILAPPLILHWIFNFSRIPLVPSFTSILSYDSYFHSIGALGQSSALNFQQSAFYIYQNLKPSSLPSHSSLSFSPFTLYFVHTALAPLASLLFL